MDNILRRWQIEQIIYGNDNNALEKIEKEDGSIISISLLFDNHFDNLENIDIHPYPYFSLFRVRGILRCEPQDKRIFYVILDQWKEQETYGKIVFLHHSISVGNVPPSWTMIVEGSYSSDTMVRYNEIPSIIEPNDITTPELSVKVRIPLNSLEIAVWKKNI